MRGGVVELRLGKQRGKVPALERFSREGVEIIVAGPESKTLVIEKEECLVPAVIQMWNAYRPAKSCSKIILGVNRFSDATGIVDPAVSV